MSWHLISLSLSLSLSLSNQNDAMYIFSEGVPRQSRHPWFSWTLRVAFHSGKRNGN
jgi:hypothetical protein